jgi:hypothetical protein
MSSFGVAVATSVAMARTKKTTTRQGLTIADSTGSAIVAIAAVDHHC